MASSQALVSSFDLDSDLPVAHDLQADGFSASRAESKYHASPNLTLYSRLVLRGASVYAGRIYLAGFLLLPSRYFSRVDHILKEIEFTVKETAYMHVATRKKAEKTKDTKKAIVSETAKNDAESGVHDNFNPLELSPSYPKLMKEWNDMIDGLLREWRTLNFASIMHVQTIMVLFPDANDPVTRSLALWSRILAAWSLLYGALCTRQFRQMRDERVMMQWAFEGEEHEGIFWNTWIMLALPAVSLAWSFLVLVSTIFITCYTWSSQASPPPEPSFPTTPSTELGFRIFTYTILGAGAGYYVLAFMQFHRLNIPTTGRWKHHMNTIMAEAIASAEEKSQLSPGP